MKIKVGKKLKVEAGLSLNSWALPLCIDACKPYTDGDSERWVTQIIITLFCFFLNIEY
ncbi:hypothetical protein ES707_15971 [subsurface metagenome]|jgi:hypothetical protein